jgi:hypothetical protein
MPLLSRKLNELDNLEKPKLNNSVLSKFNSVTKNETYGEIVYANKASKRTVQDIYEELKAWVPNSVLCFLDQKWFALKLKSTLNLMLKGMRWNFLLVERPILLENKESEIVLPDDFYHHHALYARYWSEELQDYKKIEIVYQDTNVVFSNDRNFYTIKEGKLKFINLDLDIIDKCCCNKATKEEDKQNMLWLNYHVKPEIKMDLNSVIPWYPDSDELDEAIREYLTYELYLRADQRPKNIPDINRYITQLQAWDKQGLSIPNKNMRDLNFFDFRNMIEY